MLDAREKERREKARCRVSKVPRVRPLDHRR